MENEVEAAEEVLIDFSPSHPLTQQNCILANLISFIVKKKKDFLQIC
jgi:hypothetical protein